MILSDEQMNVVTGPGISAWEPVERPVGPQPLPAWVKGAHVDFMHGACNAPEVRLKVCGDVYRWEPQRWVKEGASMYIARADDGRARVLYHKGPVSMVSLRDDRLLAQFIREKRPAKELPMVTVRATPQEDGFGGSHYWLTMEDGEPMVLRGPWHGGTPAGYVEVTSYDASGADPRSRWNRGRPWHKRGGMAGLYITEDLFLRILARHCPNVPVARVQHSYGTRLEPFDAAWGVPKAIVYEAERMRAVNKQPASEHWRVYWDGSERYCGSLRIPSYGFEEGVSHA